MRWQLACELLLIGVSAAALRLTAVSLTDSALTDEVGAGQALHS